MLFIKVPLIKHSNLSVTLNVSFKASGLILLQYQILRRGFVGLFFNLHAFLCVKLVKQTSNTLTLKMSGSNIFLR